MNRRVLSTVMAATMALMPLAGLAEDSFVQLRPLSPSGEVTTQSNVMQDNVALRGRVSTIPKGTMLMIKLDQPISSFSNRMGDDLRATLENDIFISDSVALPAGSEVVGHVANVKSASHMGKHGELDVQFTGVKTPSGMMIPIRANIVTKDNTGILKGNTYGKDVLVGVGYAAGGTGLGAVLGTASGSLIGATGAGAVFGTAMGGIAGIAYAMMRQGKEVVLPSGSRLSLSMEQDVTVNP